MLGHIINQLGEVRKDYYNAVAPPIIQTSNFVFDKVQDFRDAIKNEMGSHLYTRGNNPTVAILREKVAALENTEDCLVFSSGSAAVAAAILSQVKSGDHILSVRHIYSWTQKLLSSYLTKYDVRTSFVDGKDLTALQDGIQENTSLIVLESPTTMTFDLQDLRAVSDLAKKHGIVTFIDNSCGSSFFQKPADLGIDIIVHSGTKYINGHSDVVCGFICSSSSIIQQIFSNEYMTLGAIISPYEAGLILRGLRTYPIRMERIQDSTRKVVEFLSQHPIVEKIHYPAWDRHAQYDLYQNQMTGYGGLFSIEVKAPSIRAIDHMIESLDYFLFAVSWGGHESLVLPIAAFYQDEQEEQTLPWNFIRLYIGLEEPELLISDLSHGLDLLNDS